MSNYAPYITTATVTAGVLGSVYYAYYIYKETQRKRLPTEWKQVGTLQDMYVYPIKSCGAIRLDSAECTILGLKQDWLRDRILMVVDDKSNFITARAYPELLLVHPTVRSSILTIEHKDLEPVNINLAEVVAIGTPKTARVWGVPVPVFECGQESSDWFTKLLDKSEITFRLVYYASQAARTLRGTTNKIYRYTKNDTGALPDEVPFNLINEASVEDLNTRLKDDPVTHRVFRPNFVLKGGTAYDEDNWKFVKIGENIFEIIKPCTRCIMTTIDPETGVRNANTEPLETLKSYRQIEDPEVRRSAGNSPKMGIQMALRSGPGGQVSINDPIYVA